MKDCAEPQFCLYKSGGVGCKTAWQRVVSERTLHDIMFRKWYSEASVFASLSAGSWR